MGKLSSSCTPIRTSVQFHLFFGRLLLLVVLSLIYSATGVAIQMGNKSKDPLSQKLGGIVTIYKLWVLLGICLLLPTDVVVIMIKMLQKL